MKKLIYFLFFYFYCSIFLFAEITLQLQTESEKTFREGFHLLVEPHVKYADKFGKHSFHFSIEWELPVIKVPSLGKIEFEEELKLSFDNLSVGIQNEIDLSVTEGVFSDELTFEPFLKINDNLTVGGDIEFDLLSKNNFTFDLEIEPIIKYQLFKNDYGVLGIEIEAPVLQLIEKMKLSATIVESLDIWFVYKYDIDKKISFDILAGGGYNISKSDFQYRIEPAIKIKL